MQSLLAVILLSLCALTAASVSSETPQATYSNNSSCGCNGTASFASELGLDIIFVVDISQAMDSDKLSQASLLIESIANSLLEPQFDRWNGSDSNSTYWNAMELGFGWFNNGNGSDFNATSTRDMLEMFAFNVASAWNNGSDYNATSTRDMLEMFAFNVVSAWNNGSDYNATSTRDMLEMFAFNVASAWNNGSDYNATSTRDMLEMFAFNVASAWTNGSDYNTTSTRDMLEMFAFNVASAWNNGSDYNATSTRDMLEMFAFNVASAWNNGSDYNSTFSREFMELLPFNFASAWNNNSSDSNSTYILEMLDIFGSFSGNSSGNGSRIGLVAVSDMAEIMFDFSAYNNSTNLTRSSSPYANIRSGIATALDMFAHSDRSSHQLIYVISASELASVHSRVSLPRIHSPEVTFKRAGGTIVVADVSATGAKPALRNLASPGFYNEGFRDDVSQELQMLCEVNCS